MSSGEADEIAENEARILRSNMLKVTSASAGILASTIMTYTATSFPTTASAKDSLIWKKVDIPTRETLFDISFDSSKPEHGWLVGAKGTFLETFDGGNSWSVRSFTNLDEDVSYISISYFLFIIRSNILGRN